jgi:chemotaxis protein CheZ
MSVPDQMLANGDSPELEALFDSIVHQSQPLDSGADTGALPAHRKQSADDMYAQIGLLTRKLHETLRALGYDRYLEKMISAIPDTRDKLNYIARLTANAADRVLDATDIAQPVQDELGGRAGALSRLWQQMFDGRLSVEDLKRLAGETRCFLLEVPEQTGRTSSQLNEIIMAQDFQDLTGQVIKKMMEMVKEIENDLLDFLVTFSPGGLAPATGLMPRNAPPAAPVAQEEPAPTRREVDDLLASLGF